VRKQVETGVDIVNEGETGKPSYATYVKDRQTGFAESEPEVMMPPANLADFPE
jgi:5-methyltetrahydropteroyltriglutamate--homocysteine methyltransferase